MREPDPKFDSFAHCMCCLAVIRSLQLRLRLLFASGDVLKGGCAKIALLMGGLWGFKGGYTIPYEHTPIFLAMVLEPRKRR